ncbi:hypothetical protein NBRC116590_08230 [Pelagimonas sp. KU-00592-HH]
MFGVADQRSDLPALPFVLRTDVATEVAGGTGDKHVFHGGLLGQWGAGTASFAVGRMQARAMAPANRARRASKR